MARWAFGYHRDQQVRKHADDLDHKGPLIWRGLQSDIEKGRLDTGDANPSDFEVSSQDHPAGVVHIRTARGRRSFFVPLREMRMAAEEDFAVVSRARTMVETVTWNLHRAKDLDLAGNIPKESKRILLEDQSL